jgi:hypothetical protein
LSAEFPLTKETKVLADIQGASLLINGKNICLTGDGSLSVDELTSMPKLRLNALSSAVLPQQFALHQNYPNPFNPTTKIRYDIPVGSKVTLKIYDLLGQELTTLVNCAQEAGFKSIIWDAGDYPTEADGKTFSFVKKLVMVK